MLLTIPPRPRSAKTAFLAELAWPTIFLALSLAFTIPFFLLKTSRAASNDEPRCMANSEAIFPWNETVNEYWDSSTALFITLGSGRYTYPEAKAIDVLWDLLVGRGGQILAAAMAFTVIRKSLTLSMEQKSVPVSLAFGVYFRSITVVLVGSILQNLSLRSRARQHQDKAVPLWRLSSWFYLCVYVLILPTVISAMTGYQTTGSIYFHPAFKSTGSLADASGLTPNPGLMIRDGSRVGLSDNVPVALPEGGLDIDYGIATFNTTYDSILGCKSTFYDNKLSA